MDGEGRESDTSLDELGENQRKRTGMQELVAKKINTAPDRTISARRREKRISELR